MKHTLAQTRRALQVRRPLSRGQTLLRQARQLHAQAMSVRRPDLQVVAAELVSYAAAFAKLRGDASPWSRP